MAKIVYFNEPNSKIFDDEMIYPSICHGYTVLRESPSDLSQLDFIVTNEPDFGLISKAKKANSAICVIFITEQPALDYSKSLKDKEDELLDHIISINPISSWDVEDLRIILQKYQKTDIFGIEKYLAPGTEIIEKKITGSSDKETLKSFVQEFTKDYNFGQNASRHASGVAEELIMNTVYDAPLAAGIPNFENYGPTDVIELQEEHQGQLKIGFDGRILAISTCDPFGRLKKDTFFKYMKKLSMERDSDNLIDTKKGGAGLGFFKILYSSHSLICNVKSNDKTEVISLMFLKQPLKDFKIMPRSIHYFEDQETS